jgi:DNA-binding HxlR family transcriptional regulator/putative sterol carrier protein
MSRKRTYPDGCAAAHGMDLIGERWALLVVRELILGPKRFTDLRDSLPGVSPNVLTQRLEELEQTGIVRRRKLNPPAAAWVYELTEWGQQLEPVITTLGRWAARSPLKPHGGVSVNSLILSFRTMFDPKVAEGFNATVELRIGEERFHSRFSRGQMQVIPGSAEKPDAVIQADPETFVEVIYAGRTFADATRAGKLKVEGDKSVARRFLTFFPLPEQAVIPH